MQRVVLFVVACLCAFAACDLPVHCLYATTKGTWRYELTDQVSDKSIVKQCDIRSDITPTQKMDITLQVPNVAVDQSCKKGTWTLIYDQGFEVIINNNKYFAFFNYTMNGAQVVSNCDRTFTGWYHEVGVAAKKWGCFRAYKVQSDLDTVAKPHTYTMEQDAKASEYFKNDKEYIKKINSVQNSWTATAYPHLEFMTNHRVQRLGGNPIPQFKSEARKQHMAEMRKFQQDKVSVQDIPKFFDWRNVSGQNFVSPVRNQGGCGSCYAFAATAMFEARMRVATKNAQQPVFAPQEIVSCSSYSQGCEGGFPYLISKYAEDFGVIEEHCYPYSAQDTNCTASSCPDEKRQHFTDISYIGGYYGATTVQGMQEDILKNGGIAVSFEVCSDFRYYKKGIYIHTKDLIKNDPEPFVVTNHVVLIVGWGEENGTPYWIVKNSWGPTWGMNGYFWIRRGTDEVGIESLVPTTVPVL